MIAGQESIGEGQLCTSAESSEAFLARVYQPGNERLAIDRSGAFWEAVAVARLKGERGVGRRIAILDVGFDLGIERLRKVASPLSQVNGENLGLAGRHGTAVALLVHEVAPEAELLLIDVRPGLKLHRLDVAAGLEHAASAGVDVINMSLEFGSTCKPRDRSVIDLDLLLSPNPPSDEFLEQVRAWLTITEPYASGGCLPPCVLCTALDRIPADVLVTCAAGNTDRPVCPACFTRSLGVGFELETLQTVEASLVLNKAAPQGFEQNLLVEASVTQPPGFLGTSFAAPLLSGLGALVAEPVEVGTMARLPFANFPATSLAWMMRQTPDAVTEDSIATLEAGFLEFGAHLPEAHRHWEQPTKDACVLCSVFMVDWYRTFIASMIGAGRADRAVQLGMIARYVAPESPDLAMNIGTALARVGRAQPGGSEHRREYLESAAIEYRRSLTLRPDSTVIGDHLARVEADLRAEAPEGLG